MLQKHINLIFSNILSLGSIQIANYIIPMLTIPYIVVTIGVENYGILALANALTVYFMIFIDYGFNFTSTREIAANSQDSRAIQTIYSSTLAVKFLFLLICSIIFAILAQTVSFINGNVIIFYYAFFAVIGNAFIPTWLFHGLQKMRSLSVITLGSKILSAIAIFIFIKSENDTATIPLINSLSILVGAIVSLWLAYYKFGVFPSKISGHHIYYSVKQGLAIFLANVSKNIYTSSLVLILGVFSPTSIVGEFAIAEKFLQLIKSFISPIIQAFYPALASLANKKTQEGTRQKRELIVYAACLVLLFTVLSGISMYFYSNQLINVIFGEKLIIASEILKIFSIVPIIVGISAITCNLMILVDGKNVPYLKIYATAAVTSIFMSFALGYFLSFRGLALSMIFSELLVVFLSLFYLRRQQK